MASWRPYVPYFAAELERELDLLSAHLTNDAGGSVLKVVTAQFQADAFMAGQIRNKHAVMVLSTDTDIPLFTGDNCVSIKGFSKKNFELVCTSKTTLQCIMTYIGTESKAQLVPAEHPIFEGISNDRLRSLMMVIVGCDVFPSGVKNIGIPTLARTVSLFRSSSLDSPTYNEAALFERLVAMLKKEFKPILIKEASEVSREEAEAVADGEAEEIANTLIDALVYEPTNKVDMNKTYLGGVEPAQLFKYCDEFAVATTQVKQGPVILKCKGVGGKDHNFLAACGHSLCGKCNHVICTHCQMTIDMNGTRIFCLLCGATELLVPDIGTEAAISIDIQRQRLLGVHQFTGANDLDSDEVEDVLEMMDFLRDYRAQVDTVQFPLYKTAEMETMTTKWEDVAEIDFSGGGAFIADGTINQRHIPHILHFFAAVATFSLPDEKHTQWQKDKAIYDALPKLIIDFAGNARVDSGYRLQYLHQCERILCIIQG